MHSEQHMDGQSCYVKCISWAGIVAGALVAVGLSFLLNLLGVSLDLSVFSASAEGSKTIAMGGFIVLLIISVVVMFIAGKVAGKLGRFTCKTRKIGILHGFLAWVLALIISIVGADSLNKFIVGHVNGMVYQSSHYGQLTSSEAASLTSTIVADASKDLASVSTDKKSSVLSIATFLTFLIFFVGAVASCLGGYCAARKSECIKQ